MKSRHVPWELRVASDVPFERSEVLFDPVLLERITQAREKLRVIVP